jgi:serine/threonine protein kinase
MGTSYKQIHMAILHDSPDFTKNQFLSDSKHAQDFINQCLTKDMTARPNASDLLSHPWLTKQSRKSVYQPKRSTFVGQITDDATKMIYAHNKLIEILGWVKLS